MSDDANKDFGIWVIKNEDIGSTHISLIDGDNRIDGLTKSKLEYILSIVDEINEEADNDEQIIQ